MQLRPCLLGLLLLVVKQQLVDSSYHPQKAKIDEIVGVNEFRRESESDLEILQMKKRLKEKPLKKPKRETTRKPKIRRKVPRKKFRKNRHASKLTRKPKIRRKVPPKKFRKNRCTSKPTRKPKIRRKIPRKKFRKNRCTSKPTRKPKIRKKVPRKKFRKNRRTSSPTKKPKIRRKVPRKKFRKNRPNSSPINKPTRKPKKSKPKTNKPTLSPTTARPTSNDSPSLIPSSSPSDIPSVTATYIQGFSGDDTLTKLNETQKVEFETYLASQASHGVEETITEATITKQDLKVINRRRVLKSKRLGEVFGIKVEKVAKKLLEITYDMTVKSRNISNANATLAAFVQNVTSSSGEVGLLNLMSNIGLSVAEVVELKEVSAAPSDSPSSKPSSKLSVSLSAVPSDNPSSLPSSKPSDIPSNTLSVSKKPSLLPSVISTPRYFPSLIPSSSPSDSPSLIPSSSPSDLISAVPSDSPSLISLSSPSDSPSLIPLSSLSEIPSIAPSDSLSLKPTFVPILKPSLEPSFQPSTDNPSLQILANVAYQINFLEIQRERGLSLTEENFDTIINSKSLSVDTSEKANATEDYYSDLSYFITQDTNDPFKCKCVDCALDEICGGLWKGNKYKNTENGDIHTKKIHIVVSHCKSSLDWLEEFVEGFDIASMHVITKCGEPISNIKAPEIATIKILKNVGRCDHTYAYYITNIIPNIIEEDEANESIVVFLKDDISAKNLHQSGEWNNFETLLYLASSDNGFACGITPGNVDFGAHKFFLSTYHEVKTLFDFSMKSYSRNAKGYAVTASEFISPYSTLGDWWRSIKVDVPSQLVQVCYGGVFAAKVENIRRRDLSVWNAIEKSLSRGNNIQEGHYAERSWAALLSTPLQPFQIDALLYKSDGVYINKNSMHGALMTRPQLFLHAGIFGTHSTELIANYLIEYEPLLKMDGYNIAVYGKFENGIHGFPNIDRLASCMWSNVIKSTFPDHQKEVTLCPKNLLPVLNNYMKRSQRESYDFIISNPWLVQRDTAQNLGIFIDRLWDVTIVIYYRRYFEWITSMFDHYRKEFLDGLSPQEMTYSTFRYIDFIRKHNTRLFNEDMNTSYYDTMNAKKKRRSNVLVDQFHFTSNYDIKELTDFHEYTYFVAKEYGSVARFHVNIVNFHDIRGPAVNFVCHVLNHADNSCKAAIDEDKESKRHKDINREDFMQSASGIALLNLETALEDIVIAAFAAGRLEGNNIREARRKSEQLHLWIEMVRSAFLEKNMTVKDLPFECLDDFETLRLLQVSLAYEQSLLPMFFASPKGERNLRDLFSKWRFCSVHTNEILQDSQWDFLFESAANFTGYSQYE